MKEPAANWPFAGTDDDDVRDPTGSWATLRKDSYIKYTKKQEHIPATWTDARISRIPPSYPTPPPRALQAAKTEGELLEGAEECISNAVSDKHVNPSN